MWGEVFDSISDGTGKYIVLIGGISVMVLVVLNQNGLVREWIAQVALGALEARGQVPVPRAAAAEADGAARGVDDETGSRARAGDSRHDGEVRRNGRGGAVLATLRPGRVLGLIGPNGAGKTTLIDAVTGFKRAEEGTLLLDGENISRLSPTKRARAGVGRSFQSLELFEDSTVLANLRSASDPHDFGSYFGDLVYPRTRR